MPLKKPFSFLRFIAFVFLLATPLFAPAQESGVPGAPWRASDDLGRVVVDPADVPALRDDRKVGIFYFLWCDESVPRDRNLPENESRPYDLSKTELIDPAPAQKDALVGTDGQMHYWGEPLFGYYDSRDPFVMRRHLRLVADAGIDALIFDTTNAVTYPDVYLPLCDLILEAFERGEAAPQVVFMTHTNTTATVQKLWNEFYSKEKYRPVFFLWKGKPLLLAKPDEVPAEMRDFFTLRDAYWPTDGPKNSHDAWRWVDAYPQAYSWRESENVAEQLNVSPAQNLARDSGAAAVWMGERIGRGRSFVYGKEANRLAPVEGLNYAQQWERALEVDPEFLMITGWNEWIAGRWWIDWGNRYAFVDQYDLEYSRDVEPERGPALDAYYLQTIDGIRRFKGVPRAPGPAPRKTIDLAGGFEQWDEVEPTLRDYSGETERRDHAGTGGTRYASSGGRNDLIASKVARDDENVYFYLETREPITPALPDGLCLALDLDDNLSTGWRGAELIVGAKYNADGSVLAQYYDSKDADAARAELVALTKKRALDEYPETHRLVVEQTAPYASDDQLAALSDWDARERDRLGARKEALELRERARRFRAKEQTVALRWRLEGNKFMLAVPVEFFSAGAKTTAVSFKWLDDVPLTTPANFYDRGDVAPESSFFYRIEFEPK